MRRNVLNKQINDWTIWLEVLELIKKRVTRAVYNAWLEPITKCNIDCDTNIMYVGAGEGMVNDVLARRYKELIEQCAEQVLNEPYRVIIETDMEPTEETPATDSEITYELESEDKQIEYKDGLLSKYTFENFISGKGNQLAYGVAKATAEHPSLTYNPLFIYSESGLGKTHLLHAIGNEVSKAKSKKNVLYVSSEEFTQEFINAIGVKDNKALREFKRKYRKIDVLLIDDIQFLEGKEATQEEFFHTFNDLYNNNKQVVIASDRAPGNLDRLQDRLTSRFQWNMVVDIEAPDYETRVAILNSKARQMKVEMDEPAEKAMKMIAGHIKNNVRELEGALTRLTGFSTILNKKITPELVRETLTDILEPEEKIVTSKDIKEAVCRKFNVKVKDLDSAKRSKDIVVPRHIAMYLCREIIEMSFEMIGREFGNRNHTTVITACDKLKKKLQNDKELEALVFELINEL